MTVCFCTLAIHAPYRRRAQHLCASAPAVPWVVLTDEPDDFSALPVRAIRHTPTGPMAVDYLERLPAHLPAKGTRRGAAAYHDKRFALLAALEDFDTAIYVDADSRLADLPPLGIFPSGIAVLPIVQKSIAEHLEAWGAGRMPAFVELAHHLTGNADILQTARWCHEAFIAITKDGRESRFFTTWSLAADFLQARDIYSGEGGVIGLAAAHTGWRVDFEVLTGLAASLTHEGGGPKKA